MSVKDRWTSRLEKVKELHRGALLTTPSQEGFDKALERALTEYLHFRSLEGESEEARLSRYLIEPRFGRKLQSDYRRLLKKNAELNDARLQEVWSDIRDHGRVLLFRMLTGLGISVLILCTGRVAQVMEIPIPLMRLIP